MGKLRLWLKATRASFFGASLIPVLVGTALASRSAEFQLLPMALALLVILSNHAGANLINDYYDALGSDAINRKVTPFSGGSRVIQLGLLTRKAVLTGAVLAYGLGLGTGLGLTFFYQNPLILLLAAAGTLLGIFYSITSVNGMARGWGELTVGLAFGPLAVMGSFILQTGFVNLESFWAGIPVGFLIIGVLILNEFPDREADQKAGKRNLIVRVGYLRGVWVYLAIISLAYLAIFAGVISGIFPVTILFSTVTIPLAVWILLELRRYYDQVPQIIPALAGNIGLHFITGIFLCLGLWWQ
ncbi:MAG TPA: prenyltransferase [Bacillota bacterium]